MNGLELSERYNHTVDTQKTKLTKQTAPLEDDESPQYDGPSKSQLKRESTALQDMGTQLVELSASQLDKIAMPDALRIALREAQRITKNGAIRRQRQYIGKLMRDVDIEPIKAALDEIKGVSVAAKAHQQGLERLRTQLIENEDVIGDIARQHPGTDIQHLRQLRRNAIKEQAQNKPPRAYREIFRVLRELQSQATEDTEITEESP
jgi:ribosome-associated protein